jgi:hypothetical protein
MKKIFILFLFTTFFAANIHAQTSPIVWLGGTNEFPGQPEYGNFVLKFVGNNIQVQQQDLKMNFESTMAVATDSLGEILFYTNGCHIATANGDTMPNGSGLNPGDMADWTCPTAGYACPKGALALPLPGSTSMYYLFHLGINYETEKRLTYGPFYYSVIDMSLNNGKGAVISKNNVLVSGKLEPFSAVRHGNGRDWWLVIPQFGDNKYTKILFASNGVSTPSTQAIGDSLSCRYIGSTVFSTDGKIFGRYQNCKLEVLDFDRCAGEFSNPRLLPLPQHAFGGGGVAFSPNGQKVIVTTQLSILEANLTSSAPELDTIVASPDLYGTSLGLIQYDPLGRLLIANMSREKHYHIIKNPDGNLSDFNFQLKGSNISRFSVRTLPNFPNFNLYDLPNSICDSLGISNSKEPNILGKIKVYPNPATNMIVLETSDIEEGRLFVYNSIGALMLEKNINFAQSAVIPVQNWPRGNYFLKLGTITGEVHFAKIVLH